MEEKDVIADRTLLIILSMSQLCDGNGLFEGSVWGKNGECGYDTLLWLSLSAL